MLLSLIGNIKLQNTNYSLDAIKLYIVCLILNCAEYSQERHALLQKKYVHNAWFVHRKMSENLFFSTVCPLWAAIEIGREGILNFSFQSPFLTRGCLENHLNFSLDLCVHTYTKSREAFGALCLFWSMNSTSTSVGPQHINLKMYTQCSNIPVLSC